MNITSNSIKKELLKVLKEKEYPDFIGEVKSYPLKKVIGPLFSALHGEDKVKWHAVACFGEVLKEICKEDVEYGRVFIRRLIWMLSDESGGIPWGVPEVMGEVLAKVDFLAKEYSSILIYQIIDIPGKADLFLEYEPLRRGGYWAVARFSLEYPNVVKEHLVEIIDSFEKEKDLFIKLMGILIFKNLHYTWAGAKNFLNHKGKMKVFWQYVFKDIYLSDVAQDVVE